MENIALTLENVTGKGLGFKLKDISAKFENGYIYAIIGKNGAGKTTLFNYILARMFHKFLNIFGIFFLFLV